MERKAFEHVRHCRGGGALESSTGNMLMTHVYKNTDEFPTQVLEAEDEPTLRFTMLGDGCGRSLQHVLRQVNEHLVELPTTQQVEVLDDLQETPNVSAAHSESSCRTKC